MTGFAEGISRVAERLVGCSRIVVATGAGMSKESGVPTFRDAPNALWANYDPEELATREGFRRNPELVWRWYADRRKMIAQAKPNDGHRALAEMETMFEAFVVLTQNIDNLHREAGSKNLVELHGNIFRYKCFDNDHPVASPDETTGMPPQCTCGSPLRPAVVWFGEMLDEGDVARSFDALESCQAILVVGTSGLVYPAAGFAATAKARGASVIEINPEVTPISAQADVCIHGPAGEILPVLVERLREAGCGR